MSQRVFHIIAEVRPVTDATLDRTEVAGAAIRCLVPAASPADALVALFERLKADGLELLGIEWPNPEDCAEDELSELARSTRTVQYGTFHTWGHDAPDAS